MTSSDAAGATGPLPENPAESESPDESEIIDAEIVPDPAPSRPDLTLPPPPAFDYTDAGVPTLDYVRDRIEGRAGTALGHQELQHRQVQAQADAAAERERLARAKLDEIRKSLGGS